MKNRLLRGILSLHSGDYNVRVPRIFWNADISFTLCIRANISTTVNFTKGGVELGHPDVLELVGSERVERIDDEHVRVHFQYLDSGRIKRSGSIFFKKDDIITVDSSEIGLMTRAQLADWFEKNNG